MKIQIDGASEQGPQTVSAEELKGFILSGQKIKIVDLRIPEEFNAKHIQKSVNIPLELLDQHKLVEEVYTATQQGSPCNLIFVSLQSPDIDDYAARQCIALYEEKYNAAPAQSSFSILLGGFSNWASLFGSDPSLIA